MLEIPNNFAALNRSIRTCRTSRSYSYWKLSNFHLCLPLYVNSAPPHSPTRSVRIYVLFVLVSPGHVSQRVSMQNKSRERAIKMVGNTHKKHVIT